MADIPHSWEAYARLQRELASTSCIAKAAAIEEALNLVHQPDIRPEHLTEAALARTVETAARRDRHRAQLRRCAAAKQADRAAAVIDTNEDEPSMGVSSLDDVVHASRELSKLKANLREPDWELLTGVAAGISYEELAIEHATSPAALRSRVCRLRQAMR